MPGVGHDEAFEELEEAMKEGEIATIAQAHRFLSTRGIEYAYPESVGQLLKRRKVKLKSGRPRYHKADSQEERFKKVRSEPQARGRAALPAEATEGFSL